MDTYTYAWKFAIPDPSSVTFVNHSYYADFSSAGPCVAVTVEGSLEITTPTANTLFKIHWEHRGQTPIPRAMVLQIQISIASIIMEVLL